MGFTRCAALHSAWLQPARIETAAIGRMCAVWYVVNARCPPRQSAERGAVASGANARRQMDPGFASGSSPFKNPHALTIRVTFLRLPWRRRNSLLIFLRHLLDI